MTFSVTVAPVQNAATATSVAVSLVGCTAGNAIIGIVTWNVTGTTVGSITATGESNATLIGSPPNSTGSNGTQICQLFYIPALAASGTKTVTVNWSGTMPDGTICAMEVSGGNSTLPDPNASWHFEFAATVATTTPSGSVTTNTAHCLILTAVIGGQLADPTVPAGFTSVPLTASTFRQGAAYKLDSGAAGTVTPTWTIGTSDQYSLAIAAFQVTSGGGGGGVRSRLALLGAGV